MKTEAAQVAAIIRKELKKNGIKATVKSSNFAGGNSVNITTVDLLPAAADKIRTFCDTYSAGDFDGMVDLYTYRKTEGPTAKYVMYQNRYSDEMYQAAWNYTRANYQGMDSLPADYTKARWECNETGDCANDITHRLLSSNWGDFWTAYKPRVQA